MSSAPVRLAPVALAALVGCTGAAPTLAWQPAGDCGDLGMGSSLGTASACAHLDGDDGSHLGIGLVGSDLVVSLSGVRDGTTLAAGGATATVADGFGLIRIPIGETVAKQPIGALDGATTVELGQAVTLALPGHKAATIPIPPIAIREGMIASATKVAKGPLLFGKEPTAPAARHVALLAIPREIHPVVGEGKQVTDIDWIAIVADGKQHPVGFCEYRRGTSSVTEQIEQTGIDRIATVYERRTGKEVTHNEFVATEGPCQSTPYANGTVTTRVENEAIRTWLALTVDLANGPR